MQLLIDNFDNLGPVDYSGYLDAERLPNVTRQLNKPSTMQALLVCANGRMTAPHQGSRVWLKKADGTILFAGYLTQQPACDFAGRTSEGAIYRYGLRCASDEWLLDRKALPQRLPYTSRTAGAIVRQMTEDVEAGRFDCSGVEECDTIPFYAASVQQKWSEHVLDLALRARASYRAEGGTISFKAIGGHSLTIDEADEYCDRGTLKIECEPCPLNDVTVIGQAEPRTYVKDYFEGDGYTLSFSLAGTPVGAFEHTAFEEEFTGTQLNPVLWKSVRGSTAQVGNGMLTANGNALVQLVEQLEMGGGIVLQHGCFEFQSSSAGIVGGLFAGGILNINCVAGIQVAPGGTESMLQAMVNGTPVGPTIPTVAGHQYELTTRVFADAAHRSAQVFHSSLHPAGAIRGGDALPSDARVVIEVHDIDPAIPATLAAPSIVLYDEVVPNIAEYCDYALLSGDDLHCTVAYTRMRRNGGTLVRSAIPGQPFRTRLQGALADGGECRVNATELYFLAAYVPEASEQIVVSYRTGSTARAEQSDPAAIAALANTGDDGVRSSVHGMKIPEARTTLDCANAALALLDDGTQDAWQGEYKTWSDFLGASDVHPGDAVEVTAPSRNAQFAATLREVEITVQDLRSDRSMYRLRFANDAAQSLSCSLEAKALRLLPVGVASPGNWTLAPVKDAEFSQILASQVTIATNCAPQAGGGFEVRTADQGWGLENDRSLWGRFSAQSFIVPRLSRSQSYYIRQFDNAIPPNYSTDSMLLRVDWPL